MFYCVQELARYSLEDFIDIVRNNSDCIHVTDKKGASVVHHLAIKGTKDLLEHSLICGGGKQARSSHPTPILGRISNQFHDVYKD